MVPIEQKFFFAVGQQSFESKGRHFSTLVPIATLDGEPIDDPRRDFPNRGRVWWMVRGDSRVTRAPPGCLLMAGVELALEPAAYDNKDHYQALQPSLPRPTELIEILTSETVISDPNALLDDFRMSCNHEPTRFVLVRVGDSLFGPLRVELSSPNKDREMEPEIYLSKPATPHKIFRIRRILSPQTKGYFQHETLVWPEARILGHNEGHSVRYEIITGTLFEELCAEGEEIELVSLGDAIRQITTAFLTRKQRQGFLSQFEAFVAQAHVAPEVLERVKQILLHQTDYLAELNEFFDSLLNEDSFKPRIEEAVQEKIAERIDELAAQIDARAQDKVKVLTQKRADLEAQVKQEENRFKRTKELLQRDLDDYKERRLAETDAENDRKIEELEKLEEDIKGTLESVADRFAGEREALIQEYLALEPLLQRLVRVNGESSAAKAGSTKEAKPLGRSLSLPAIQERVRSAPEVAEEEFFQRFVEHVEACGFTFEQDALLAFHLSVKVLAPVILGGFSGTGKSSLPVLYSEALIGEEGTPEFLAIDVSPSWTSPADLLGYTDALEHCFVPSPSDLYGRLIHASEEYRINGPDAALHSVCLDEMNLAQPEHYLADIIQAVSRSSGQRTISVFAPDAVRVDDPFRKHARVELTPNLLLFGTVNFDETTRPLSLRLLDRCNMIELRPMNSLPSLSTEASTGSRRAPGPSVRQLDLQRWNRNTAVLPRVVEVLGEIQPILQRLNCGITPRRQAAILHFVANAPDGLCSVDRALDMQLRQRVLPQIRGLYRAGAIDAVRQLIEKLDHDRSFPRAVKTLIDLERQERESNVSFSVSEE